MGWDDSADIINREIGDPDSGFGDWFVLSPFQGTGDPIPFSGVRLRRSPDEYNPNGAFEGLEIRELDFTDPPPIGLGIPLPVPSDVVTIDAVDYVVTSIRNPDPTSGTMVLVLNRRTAIR